MTRGCPRVEEGAMFRNRFLILLGGCFLAASAAWADEVGYVDCTNHPEEIQVFAKARKTPNLIAVDGAATAALQTASTQLASAKVRPASTSAAVARPAPAAALQPQPALAQPASVAAPASKIPEMTSIAQPSAVAQKEPPAPVPTALAS